MEVDIEQTLARLPEQEQRKLRAALGRRGGRARRNECAAKDDEQGTRREERERSPRPTKTNDDGL
jgi:hypothetical protein